MKESIVNERKRIAIVTPEYLPQNGGVAHYVYKLSKELSEDFDVDIITTKQRQQEEIIHDKDGFKVYYSIKKWNIFGFLKLNSILNKNKYSFLNIQYVPQMYAWQGLNFSLPIFSFIWKITGKNLSFYFHEIALSFSLKNLLINPIALFHKIAFIIFVHSARKIGLSCDRRAQKWQKYLPWQRSKFTTIPLYSNLSYKQLTSEDTLSLRTSLGIAPDELILLFMGSLHPSRLISFVLDALDCAIAKGHKVKLLCTGFQTKNIKSMLDAKYKHLIKYVITTGPCSNDQLTRYFNIADIYLCPYDDGICFRRTSAMAGLQFGVCVITTCGSKTEDIFSKLNNSALILCKNKNDFMRAVEDLITNKEKRINIGQKGEDFYLEHFNSKKIIKLYKEYIFKI